jgi:FMN phosphatase YigB (HAD superfamily)
MKPSHIRAIFFDAGNTLLYPRLDERARDLTAQGFPAGVEDFHAAERAAKQKLDEWLWPQIRKGEVPRTIDHYYWAEYLRALMGLIGAPEHEHLRPGLAAPQPQHVHVHDQRPDVGHRGAPRARTPAGSPASATRGSRSAA